MSDYDYLDSGDNYGQHDHMRGVRSRRSNGIRGNRLDYHQRNGGYESMEVRPVAANDRLQFFRPGLQYGQLRKLKQKHFMPQRKVDMRTLTVIEAKQAFDKFINGCLQHGIRYGMIVHGEGEHSDSDEMYPMLKNKINVWLREYSEVLAFLSAKDEHGGTGSTYLILKKRSEGFSSDSY